MTLIRSVWWLQWSHVFSDMVRSRSAFSRSSSSRLQWSHVFSDMVSDREIVALVVRLVLQWSHVFSDMVSDYRYTTLLRGGVASMEPCLFRHGKLEEMKMNLENFGSFNGAMSFQTW
ncbi:protein of unknown function [Methanoculleus bourgensis]|uniref:Uncharacterized protein n=1 Tax=Methanoculleus bourgensis TaxID=83986 RepID=A0A110BIJ3_9EURY|nr:protein of unknown function [Methanoculleus bourgensis]